jgi:two-component system, NtrC family, sensor kinase
VIDLGPKTRRRLFPGGLRAQLLLGLSLLIITTLSLLSAAILQLQQYQLEQASLEQAARLARFFAELDDDLALATAKSLHERGEIGYLAFIDTQRQVVRQYPELEASEAQAFITGPNHGRLEQRPHMRALSSFDGPRSGAVVVALPTSAMIQREQDYRNLFWLFGSVNVLFILLLGYAFFTFVILRPIRAISVATDRAAEGDLANPIRLMPPNEIGQLAHSFNAMLGRIDENREELERRLEALQKAHVELERTQDSLIRSEKLASVGQLAAGVAHEVGNPLAALLGYAELLRDPDTDPEMSREIADRLLPQLERIQTIIRQLLDYSRDDRSQPLEATSLPDCIVEALNLMNAHPAVRCLEIETQIAPAPPTVMAVPSAVVQILINLLINAADAMAEAATPEPRVRIAVVAGETSDVLLTVEDNGPGVSAELKSRIFDPFFTTKDPGQGTGLGLAICLSLMKRFGGDLSLDESFEPGTRFALRFPAPADDTTLTDESHHGRIASATEAKTLA